MDFITRGTTPTIEIIVDQDLTDYSCYLSIGKYGKPFFTADNRQMKLVRGDEGSVCAFTLTQEQTLSCKPGEYIMQMRSIKDDSAIATVPIDIEIRDVIEGGMIVDSYDTDR